MSLFVLDTDHVTLHQRDQDISEVLMLWSEIRDAYPDQWLIIEAIEAHTSPDHRRHLDRLAVIDKCPDGSAAMKGCRQLYREFPTREFYFLHTSREEPDIRDRSST